MCTLRSWTGCQGTSMALWKGGYILKSSTKLCQSCPSAGVYLNTIHCHWLGENALSSLTCIPPRDRLFVEVSLLVKPPQFFLLVAHNHSQLKFWFTKLLLLQLCRCRAWNCHSPNWKLTKAAWGLKAVGENIKGGCTSVGVYACVAQIRWRLCNVHRWAFKPLCS